MALRPDIGPALFFKLGNTHDAGRNHSNAGKRRDRMTLSPLGGGFCVAAHAEHETGYCLLRFLDAVFNR